jgi:ATP-binding cassette subfamily F protein 3
MRLKAEEMEESMVDVRREDKTIRSFTIPAQENLTGEILKITSYMTLGHPSTKLGASKPKVHKKTLVLKKNRHLLLSGPNGIGKSTLLESIATKSSAGAVIGKGIVVGYYRQDFSNLNFEATVYDELASAMKDAREEKLRATAAGFLITGDLIHTKVGHLSEGQKGLVAFARLVLLRPGLLILDEPTNHMNFRHLPVIAAALDRYEGAMILVSHVPGFVSKIRIDERLDLAK